MQSEPSVFLPPLGGNPTLLRGLFRAESICGTLALCRQYIFIMWLVTTSPGCDSTPRNPRPPGGSLGLPESQGSAPISLHFLHASLSYLHTIPPVISHFSEAGHLMCIHSLTLTMTLVPFHPSP